MKHELELIENMDMEKAVTMGSAIGVVIGTFLIPFTDNPGLAIGMTVSFCAAIAMILVSHITDENEAS